MPKASGLRVRDIAHRAAREVARHARRAKGWSRMTDSGHALDCAFCPEFGSRLWHQRRGAIETVSVKGGSLDDPVDLRSAVHIWTSRVLPGIVLAEGVAQFSGEPG